MNVVTICAIIACAIVIISSMAFVFFLDYKSFNKGKCTTCGHKLSLVGKDDRGGRKYKCTNCGYQILVGWPIYKSFGDDI